MLRVITPIESAAKAREQLEDAMKSLGEAQVRVADAMCTLRMFEHNFRIEATKPRDVREGD